MSSDTEKLPGEPILVVRLTEETLQQTNLEEKVQKDIAFLDSLNEPVHQIVVFPKAEYNLTSVIEGTNLAARGQNPIFHHPNILSISYVTETDIVSLAAKGLDSDAFGNLNIKVFKTLDEALAHVRALA